MDSSQLQKGEAEQDFHPANSGESLLVSSQKVKKLFERLCAESRKTYDLTQNEIDVLLFLKNHPSLDTAGHIAHYQSLSRSLVCKSVESLYDKGYLSIEADHKDRRYLHLKPTHQADAVIKELQQIKKTLSSILQRGISSQDLTSFLQVLDKIRSNLNDEFPRL